MLLSKTITITKFQFLIAPTGVLAPSLHMIGWSGPVDYKLQIIKTATTLAPKVHALRCRTHALRWRMHYAGARTPLVYTLR